MRKIIITLAAIIAMSMSPAAAQQRSSAPQRATPPKVEQTAPAQGKKVKNNGTLTNRTYKGMPVYKGAKGGMYVIRVSKKTGNEYKQYVKEDQLDKQ